MTTITSERIEILPKHLVLSDRYQARQTPGQMPLEELAASIAAQGLLQNLVVVKAKKKGQYEVVAGGRRWNAIQLLIDDGRWPKDQLVPALIVPAVHGLEASLAENVQREEMHPLDECAAFAALVGQGDSVEDVAVRFGKAPNYVRGRMKLAQVAPELQDAYRDGKMTLATLMAFAVTDDKERQRAVWDAMDTWDRQHAVPRAIRARLLDKAWTADHGLAIFVGLQAYEAAGGRATRDLFAAEDDLQGIYLQDPDILESLAQEKIQTALAELGEGWSWAEGALSYDEAGWTGYGNKYGRVQAEQRKLTKAEAAQANDLTKRIHTLCKEIDDLEDPYGDNEDTWDRLQAQLEELQQQRAAITDTAKVWSDKAKAIAGVGVYIDKHGCLDVTYGLIRPEDRRAAQAAVQAAADAGDDAPALRTSLPSPTTRPAYSERLLRQLTAHKVGVIAADLAGKPAITLAVLVAQLAQEKLGPGWARGFGLGVSLRGEALHTHAPDYAESKAAQAMDEMRQHWLDILPTDNDGHVTREVLAWALAQDQGTLVELLAWCVASTVEGVQTHEIDHCTPLDVLAATAGTDIADWWEPTGPSFLQHVSKDVIVRSVTDGVSPEAAQPLAKMKKGEAVGAAERALAGQRWIPEPMRIKAQENEQE